MDLEAGNAKPRDCHVAELVTPGHVQRKRGAHLHVEAVRGHREMSEPGLV